MILKKFRVNRKCRMKINSNIQYKMIRLDLTDLYEKEREFLYLKSTKGSNKLD